MIAFWKRLLKRPLLLVLALVLLTTAAWAAEAQVWGTPARFDGASIRKHMATPPTSTRTGWTQDYYKSDGLPYTLKGTAERQVVAQQVACLGAAYTLTDATTQQKLFNVPSNGALTLEANTTYQFECYFALSSMSATSGNCKFSPCGLGASGGTATLLSCTWAGWGLDATTGGTAAAVSGCNFAGTTADPISTGDIAVAATGTALFYRASGVIRTNAAGTIIPSVSLTTASVTPAVALNSYFRIWPIGSGTATYAGNWN